MIRVLSRLRGRLQLQPAYQKPETKKVQSRLHINKSKFYFTFYVLSRYLLLILLVDGLIRILKRNGDGRIRILNQQAPNYYPTESLSNF